jgi:hypothetical protein
MAPLTEGRYHRNDPFSNGFKESSNSVKGYNKNFFPEAVQRIKGKGMKQTMFEKYCQKNEITSDAKMDIFIVGIGDNKSNDCGKDSGKEGDAESPGILL